MAMWGYNARVKRDLGRWKERGWLTAEAEANIVAELARSGREVGLASSLGFLASVLLGLAVISFVAAHWQDVPRGVRLLGIIALIWAGFGAAAMFAERQARGFSEAAVLFSCLVFGAGIALVSQMYHIDGHPPDGVLLWFAGTFAAGILARSNAALALSMVLAVIWAAYETSASLRVQWPFLAAWGAVTAAFIWQRFERGYHLSALALALFVVSLGYCLNGGHAHGLTVGLSLAAAAAILASDYVRSGAFSMTAFLPYAVAAAYAGLFALQFGETNTVGQFAGLAIFALALLLTAIAYGLTREHRGLLWLGYSLFSIEVFGLYLKTFGSLLGTSLFFLVAGLLVAGLAYLALRIVRRGSAGAAA